MVSKFYYKYVWPEPLGEKSNPDIKNSSYEFFPDGSTKFSGMEESSDNTLNQSVNCAGGSETTVGEPGAKKTGTNRVENYRSDATVAGKASHNGGPGDSRTVGPSREQTDGVSALAVKLARMEAALQKIGLFKQGETKAAGSSDASNYEFVTADKNVNYEKNSHIGIEGNSVKTVGGTELIMNSGQFTRDVQGGNWEVRVNTGEGKIYSPTKLTFQVGTSTIVMEPNKITITADRIDLNP